MSFPFSEPEPLLSLLPPLSGKRELDITNFWDVSLSWKFLAGWEQRVISRNVGVPLLKSPPQKQFAWFVETDRTSLTDLTIDRSSIVVWLEVTGWISDRSGKRTINRSDRVINWLPTLMAWHFYNTSYVDKWAPKKSYPIHDHFGALPFDPSGYGNRWCRLRAGEDEGYPLGKASSSPLPKHHFRRQMVMIWMKTEMEDAFYPGVHGTAINNSLESWNVVGGHIL